MASFAYLCLALTVLAGKQARAACAGASQAAPLYRSWNPDISDHFYTTDKAEASATGYTPEGIRAFVFTAQVEGSVRLLRLWNDGPGDHFYTTNATEANNAVAGGYTLEDKTPMYVYPTQLCGSVPFYRLFSSGTGDHFYTIDAGERDGAEGSGWAFERVQGYLFPPAAGSADTSKSPVSSTSASASKLSLGPSTTTYPTASTPLIQNSASVLNTGLTSTPGLVLPAPTSALSQLDTSSSATPGSNAGTRLTPTPYLAALLLVFQRWL